MAAGAMVESLERLERWSAGANAAEAARLTAARDRLEESLATARALAFAAGETATLAGRLRGFLPRK